MNRTEQQEYGKLIDADKLLEEFFNVDEEEWTTPEIRTILKNAPSVEPGRPKGEVLCGFERCIYNQNGVCTKEVIDLDERVEDIFVGCPDAEWKGDADNE